jgi:hypothetical protein
MLTSGATEKSREIFKLSATNNNEEGFLTK